MFPRNTEEIEKMREYKKRDGKHTHAHTRTHTHVFIRLQFNLSLKVVCSLDPFRTDRSPVLGTNYSEFYGFVPYTGLQSYQ